MSSCLPLNQPCFVAYNGLHTFDSETIYSPLCTFKKWLRQQLFPRSPRRITRRAHQLNGHVLWATLRIAYSSHGHLCCPSLPCLFSPRRTGPRKQIIFHGSNPLRSISRARSPSNKVFGLSASYSRNVTFPRIGGNDFPASLTTSLANDVQL